MEWKGVGATAVIFLTISASLAAETPSKSTLAVRIYNNAGVSEDDLRLATLEAETILRSAGLTASWTECWYKDKESARATEHCRQPLETNTLTLRLLHAASVPQTRAVSMGYSLVNLEDRAPFFATVYSDLVNSVALGARVDPRPILGRAIAHEIGHLLLNANRHADAGLMRETWTRFELQKNDPADWEFRSQETAVMRAAVAARVSLASR